MSIYYAFNAILCVNNAMDLQVIAFHVKPDTFIINMDATQPVQLKITKILQLIIVLTVLVYALIASIKLIV